MVVAKVVVVVVVVLVVVVVVVVVVVKRLETENAGHSPLNELYGEH